MKKNLLIEEYNQILDKVELHKKTQLDQLDFHENYKNQNKNHYRLKFFLENMHDKQESQHR